MYPENYSENIIKLFQPIRWLILDVDGVLTDGRLYFTEQGEQMKAFHAQDGLGLIRALKQGLKIAVISGRDSPIVTKRLKPLGIEHIFQGHLEKLSVFQQLIQDQQIDPATVAYLGDDVIDIPVMEAVGLSIAVANALPRVKQMARWQTALRGGEGAVREVCDYWLEAQGLNAQLSTHNLITQHVR